MIIKTVSDCPELQAELMSSEILSFELSSEVLLSVR